ncbi:hypothetical protein CAI21_05660 [Alkalilimnicola ehrlichii]|uniref:Poly-beta-hydroxybutyrate polymerase N-terminal domain-containing protein n=1 Tax=Alkalilimnicola ehrlichii TaxID=351052 RepID=A0A3E0X0D0_9GAMM|nr:alpha/beta fold hydrolase [Alkalilimnicola ehrlichii]RFA30532.1 hypothetical protein CAI21_05660 [Alkalilimnicola ehrlichii]RFA38079.1 hypothetical protein CAL65_07030 [Alkalilimnicola ehrlichii]
MNLGLLERVDRQRRWWGEWYELAGLGPQRSTARIVYEEPLLRLHAYDPPPAETNDKALLLIPAPIKKSYIWDLEPEVSVVQHALAAGFRTYLIDWQAPGSAARDDGLAVYGDRLLMACRAAIDKDCAPKRVFLAGHSLGGTLAALFASVQPQALDALALLEAPVNFAGGAFSQALARAPHVGDWAGDIATVPGSLLNIASIASAPGAFVFERWYDRLQCAGDAEALRRYRRVQRWTLDETPLTRRLFEETVERLYRDNAFMTGKLYLDGKLASPQTITAPLLTVVDPRSRVVPEQAVRPLQEAISSHSKKMLKYTGDRGVLLQHVGVLVGPNAHRTLWPEIFHWLETVA